jgi:hypothetical protein
MIWTTPTVDEVKMDAEIGSYQEDTEPGRESPLAEDGLTSQGASFDLM